MLSDVCENFRNISLEIYVLDPAHFLSAPGLALKNTKVELDHLTDIDMLLMVEKGIRGVHVKANNKYMKNYDKINNHHILSIGT